MSPPTLHPRSRATSTLFTITLLASFVVVGIPHLFPCPAPRRTHADTDALSHLDGKRAVNDGRRPGRTKADGIPSAISIREEEKEMFMQLQKEAEQLERERRECPVPKPRAVIRGLMGFPTPQDATSDRERGRR